MDRQQLQGTYEGTFFPSRLLIYQHVCCLLTACSRSGCQQLKGLSLKISFDASPPTSTSATSHSRQFSLNQHRSPQQGTQTIPQIPTSFLTHWCLGPHFCRIFSSMQTLDGSLLSAHQKFWHSKWFMFFHHGVKTHLSHQTSMAPFKSLQCNKSNYADQLPVREADHCMRHLHCTRHAQVSNLATPPPPSGPI